MKFNLCTKFKLSGDQPKAVKQIVDNFLSGKKRQTLLGATGTGKTFMMANIIKELNKRVLVLANNKTLAGQLYQELKHFFPDNAVEFFISYYDYYQPEAYIASKNLHIEKDSSINDEIDEMRHKTVTSLISKNPVIVVSSVSCIYGIGEESEYIKKMLFLEKGMTISFLSVLDKLIDLNYTRNDYDFKRGSFMVKGENIFINLTSNKNEIIKLEFFDDEIENIKILDSLSLKLIATLKYVSVFPATLFVVSDEKQKEALRRIENELSERIKYFNSEGKPHRAEQIKVIVENDLEMMRELGYCQGIENYSRHLYLRSEGEAPATLIDFFKDDFLIIVDESHVTIPQVRAMYNGDRSRKLELVNYGFRLPSALDNRPLKFSEFNSRLDKVLYVSATPGDYEKNDSEALIEAIIRPTGLLDPVVEVRPTLNQIEDIVREIGERERLDERVLILTLTKKQAEALSDYLKNLDIKAVYLHSEIKSLERLDIINSLRRKEADCLIGINLLREGLDIPEVSLICILDADKEGFLRSETSLIQIIGRASRNKNGKVIMYADNLTQSMKSAIDETHRRRLIQDEYNKKHNITPISVKKSLEEKITAKINEKEMRISLSKFKSLSRIEKDKVLDELTKEMKRLASDENFEEALIIRDIINELKGVK